MAVNLSTNYLGLELKNPLVASSSPLCENIDDIKKMEDAGLSAVVLHSLFEEQVTLEEQELNRFLVQGTHRFAESLTYFPELSDYTFSPDEYVEHIGNTKRSVRIPIIGSLNGISPGGWLKYAGKIEEAGADALELNIYYLPTNPNTTSEILENAYVDILKEIKKNVHIPVAVKLNPYLTSIPNMIKRLEDSGADGVVLFNRFYQPDLDIENLEVTPNLILSDSKELRLRIRWIAILYGRVNCDLAVTGGIHTGEDAVKAVMSGAKVAMTTSSLLKNGIPHAKKIVEGMENWMERHNYNSVSEIRGVLSQKSVAQPAAFERANYMKVLHSYK